MKKCALITGATGDIGRAICLKLADIGYSIAACGFNNFDSAKKLENELKEKSVKYKVYMCDISSFSQVQGVINDVIENFKNIDVLVNNAGISSVGLFTDASEDDYDKIFSVNMKSVFNTCRLVAPYMVREKSGKIINISSMWGVSGASCEVLYSASKSAVNGFSKALAKELAPSNINVNCIAPGAIDTKMNNNLTPEEKRAFADEIPMGRFGRPEEIASLCAFLSSEESKYITGQVIVCDGGYI